MQWGQTKQDAGEQLHLPLHLLFSPEGLKHRDGKVKGEIRPLSNPTLCHLWGTAISPSKSMCQHRRQIYSMVTTYYALLSPTWGLHKLTLVDRNYFFLKNLFLVILYFKIFHSL